MKVYTLSLSLFCAILIFSCKKDKIEELPIADSEILSNIEYSPTPYVINYPRNLSTMYIPEENPLTQAGVKLGRLLFHDKILSGDSSMSCASCHNMQKAFTDGKPTAVGIAGIASNRNSMSLLNIGYFISPYNQNNLNWDGAFKTLEEQVLAPVEHPLELNADWANIVEKFKVHAHYPILFRKAFGINTKDEITKELAAKALAQYLRTLVSAGSLYDRATTGEPFVYLPEAAQRGRKIFFGDADPSFILTGKDGECAHCHSASNGRALFASNTFFNNGLDAPENMSDLGLGGIINDDRRNGLFRAVTVRNIALTAPYMHDGRFNTLEEVIEHYVSGVHPAPNLASELRTARDLPNLTSDEKEDIIAFLHTLTDTSYYHNVHFQNPFEVEANPWQ